jgi:transcriptional regulator with XRE-family HTH domain
LTQADLAEKVSVWFTAISNIERGDSEPSLELATKLADALGVSIDDLVKNEPEARPDAATEPA